MATVPDDQLAAWADLVDLAGGWVSGPLRKKLVALGAEITAAYLGEPPAPSADLEGSSLPPSATDVDGDFVDLTRL